LPVIRSRERASLPFLPSHVADRRTDASSPTLRSGAHRAEDAVDGVLTAVARGMPIARTRRTPPSTNARCPPSPADRSTARRPDRNAAEKAAAAVALIDELKTAVNAYVSDRR
jgi:hypothetical protein